MIETRLITLAELKHIMFDYSPNEAVSVEERFKKLAIYPEYETQEFSKRVIKEYTKLFPEYYVDNSGFRDWPTEVGLTIYGVPRKLEHSVFSSICDYAYEKFEDKAHLICPVVINLERTKKYYPGIYKQLKNKKKKK